MNEPSGSGDPPAFRALCRVLSACLDGKAPAAQRIATELAEDCRSAIIIYAGQRYRLVLTLLEETAE